MVAATGAVQFFNGCLVPKFRATRLGRLTSAPSRGCSTWAEPGPSATLPRPGAAPVCTRTRPLADRVTRRGVQAWQIGSRRGDAQHAEPTRRVEGSENRTERDTRDTR